MNYKSLLKVLLLVSLLLLAISYVSSDNLTDSHVGTAVDDSGSMDMDDSNPVDNSAVEKDKSDSKQKQSSAEKSTSKQSSSAQSDDSSDSDDGDFPECNLVMTKKGDGKVQVGDEVVWVITLKNSLNTAYNIHVDEKLPSNFEVISVKASQGDYNKEMNSWEITKLEEDKSANLTIKAKALKEGNYSNKAELFTDSKNINGDEISATADVEVVSKKNYDSTADKNKTKKDSTPSKKIKKVQKALKNNVTKNNNTNKTNKTVLNMKKSGNSLFAVIVAALAVLGVFGFRRRMS